MDFTLIDKAGIKQGEFGKLVNVTRVTVNLWVRDKMKPCRFIKPHVETLLNNIQTALAAEKLPLPPNTPREKRLDAILEALAE